MTFTLPIEALLFANSHYLRHVETLDVDKVTRYAAMPADTAPPIRVRKSLRVADAIRDRGSTFSSHLLTTVNASV